jgi:cytidylate kinase
MLHIELACDKVFVQRYDLLQRLVKIDTQMRHLLDSMQEKERNRYLEQHQNALQEMETLLQKIQSLDKQNAERLEHHLNNTQDNLKQLHQWKEVKRGYSDQQQSISLDIKE